jgi:hypothetical protein
MPEPAKPAVCGVLVAWVKPGFRLGNSIGSNSVLSINGWHGGQKIIRPERKARKKVRWQFEDLGGRTR